MSFNVLDITNSTTLLAIMQQIDSELFMSFTGDPQGVVAAAQPGVLGFDTVGLNLYVATVANNTVGGTTWTQISLSGAAGGASTSAAGIVQLATSGQTQAGSSQSLAVTPYGAAQTYATKGANSNITSLSGLTTPLSAYQGGTGLDLSAAGNGEILIGNGSGMTLAPLTMGSTKLSMSLSSGGITLDVVPGNISLGALSGSVSLGSQVSGTLGIANGGSGQGTLPSNGQLLIGNSNSFSLGSISGSSRLSVSPGAGTIALDVIQSALSIAASQLTGVTSNDSSVTLTSGSGTLDFSVDQSIINLDNLSGTLDLVHQTGNILPITKGGTGAQSQQGALNAIAPQGATNNQVISYNASTGNWGAASISGTGTVTSITVTGDNVLFATSVTGSPITSSGTINLASSLLTQTANTVLAGPTSGSAATPTFRALTAADLPLINLISGVTGILPASSGGTGSATVAGHKFFGNNTGSSGSPLFSSIGLADLPSSVVNTSVSVTADAILCNNTNSSAPAGFNVLTITAGTGLTGGGNLAASPTISLANTAVTPGSYTSANITVDQQGRITSAANGSGGGGSGSVTSVALEGDGVIFSSSISGSPITSSGTFNLASSLVSQSANTFLAGPSSGSAASPTFRTLALADLPASYGAPNINTSKVASFTASAGTWYLLNPSSFTANVVATLPDATACAGQTVGVFLSQANDGSYTLKLGSTSSQTIGGCAASNIESITAAGAGWILWSDGANWQFLWRGPLDLSYATSYVYGNSGGLYGILPGNSGGTGYNAASNVGGELLIGKYNSGNGGWNVVAASSIGGAGIKAVGGSSGTLTISNLAIPVFYTKTASFSISNSDVSAVYEINNPTSNVTATLPDATTCQGSRYSVMFLSNSHGQGVSFAVTSSQTINGISAASFYSLNFAPSTVTFFSDGIGWITESFPLPVTNTIFTPPNSGAQIIANVGGSNNKTWANTFLTGYYTSPNGTSLDVISINYSSGTLSLSCPVFWGGSGNRAHSDSPFTATPSYQWNMDTSGGNITVVLDDERAIGMATTVTCLKGGGNVNLSTSPVNGTNSCNGTVGSSFANLAVLSEPGESFIFMPQGSGSGWETLYIPATPGTPSVSPNANAGTGATASLSTNATDRSGVITLTTGTSLSSGAQVALTFGLLSNPRGIQLTPANSNAAGLAIYGTNTSSGFTVNIGTALSASTVYKWYYIVD